MATETASAAAVQGKLVYSPRDDPSGTRIALFRRRVAATHGIVLDDYHAFWAWSCAHPSAFWEACWDEVGIRASQQAKAALASPAAAAAADPKATTPPIYPPPRWFEGARLNYAENLLRHTEAGSSGSTGVKSDGLDSAALLQTAEADPAAPDSFHIRTFTRRELRRQVGHATRALRVRGVKQGDRVASYGSNCAANVVAFLASAAIGAIWSSCAADFAPSGVLERLKTVRPKVLFAVDGVRYNGRVHDHLSKLDEVISALQADCPPDEQSLEGVVLVQYLDDIGAKSPPVPEGCTSWNAFLQEGMPNDGEDASHIDFAQLDFNHPLWILFSSGTTGTPKAIVHRAGGMLLQSAKEHFLHGGMTEDDVFFYHSTPGWMMWNYLVSGLQTGATLVLFDGSPLRPASTLWNLAQQVRMTVFGTSAAYIAALEKSGFVPRKTYPTLAVKQVLSTGSPLRADLYPFIMEAIGADTLIGSITGGTDICSLFAGINVELPVRAGEIQARNLGMDIDVFDDAGTSIASSSGQAGDLVCKVPFPAQPLGFFSQPESRHRDTYYVQFPGVWYHGDYVALSPHGGLVMLGRSDGVLNPAGIRFGSSEIYDALEKDRGANPRSPLQRAEAWLVCALKVPAGDDEVVVLFVVVREGHDAGSSADKTSDREVHWAQLVAHVKALVREKRSARHVPRFIRRVPGVPLTLNGKLAEVPAKKLVNGAPITTINTATLQNPEILQAYVDEGLALRNELGKG